MTDTPDVDLRLPKQASRALRKLPPEVQDLAWKFIRKFNADYRRSSIHLEPVRQAKDPRLRTARVNRGWRAIVLQVADHEFVLLDIAPHDEAYRRIGTIDWYVNPTIGNFEIADMDDINDCVHRIENRTRRPGNDAPAGVFNPYTDKQLVDLGIRARLLPAVRAALTEDDALELAEGLPDLARDIVVELAAGTAYETVMERVTKPSKTEDRIDVTDLLAALAHPATQITSSDAAVAAMLDASFEEWQVFLHPEQRRLVDRTYNGPARVTGGPGTGKTVVALHRAARLAGSLTAGNEDRILLTTYNKRLSAELERKLARLVDPTALRRIDIVNVDRLALDIARELTGERRRPVWSDAELRKHWQAVLIEAGETDFDAGFLLDEWNQVILAGFITSKSGYAAAERQGRGARLSKAQRTRIWDLVERYQARLTREGIWSGEQICMAAALAENARAWTGRRRYRHIVVDEAQDLSAVHWRLLRSLCPETADDLFIAGDNFQRIYRRPLRMAPLGIDIQGRSRNLTLSYRTTRQILAKAMDVMEGADPDEGPEEPVGLDGYRSVVDGAEPRFLPQASEEAERKAVVEQVSAWIDGGADPGSIVLCMPNAKTIPRYLEALETAGHRAAELGDEIPDREAVHVTTINGLKGTEYHRVVLAGVGADRFPRRFANELAAQDPIAHRAALERERNLLFVALTRACRDLTVVWSGKPSPLLGVSA